MVKDSLARIPVYSGFSSSGGDWRAFFTFAAIAPQAAADDRQAQQGVPALERIVPAASQLAIGVGEIASVAGWTAEPTGASAVVTYGSSKSSVAKVGADGLLKGLKVGATTIAIRDTTGVETTIQVQVKKSPTAIAARAERTKLGIGEETRILTVLSGGSAGAVRFASHDTACCDGRRDRGDSRGRRGQRGDHGDHVQQKNGQRDDCGRKAA